MDKEVEIELNETAEGLVRGILNRMLSGVLDEIEAEWKYLDGGADVKAAVVRVFERNML